MTLRITRDESGRVTVTDVATGKSEVLVTDAKGSPARRSLGVTTDLPAHRWSRLA